MHSRQTCNVTYVSNRYTDFFGKLALQRLLQNIIPVVFGVFREFKIIIGLKPPSGHGPHPGKTLFLPGTSDYKILAVFYHNGSYRHLVEKLVFHKFCLKKLYTWLPIKKSAPAPKILTRGRMTSSLWHEELQ